MKKTMKEWTLNCPWGKVAMVSWGDPANPPILLVHGYMDSAATFILLIDHLPDTYYYVGFDMPGHGKSDAFPPGLLVSQLNIVEVVRLIVEQMKWVKFIFISHSMGYIVGIFFNHIFPGKITKMIPIDPAAAIAMYYYPHNKPMYWYQHLYDSYYSRYDSWFAGNSKRMTLDEAVNLLVRNRSISEDQAEVVISRSLVPVGDGKYKLSWEPRMKKITTVPLSEETLYTVITQHAPPTLIIKSSENIAIPPGRQFAASILEKCSVMVPYFYSVTVSGGHDIHITNSDSVAPHIKEFLLSEFSVIPVKSKL